MLNLYSLLGVSRYAQLDEIRRAYWLLSKWVQMDLRRSGDTSRLTEIQKAYEILSDSISRRSYDAEQDRVNGAGTQVRNGERTEYVRVDEDVAKDFPTMLSTVGIVPRMYEAFWGHDALSSAVTHTERVTLSTKQARKGISVPVELFVSHTCPVCGGRGETWSELCGVCEGKGAREMRHDLCLPIPHSVRDGTCLTYSVTLPFTAKTQVELHIVVQ